MHDISIKNITCMSSNAIKTFYLKKYLSKKLKKKNIFVHCFQSIDKIFLKDVSYIEEM